LELIVFLVVLILSLSFHEAAHAWSADRLGDPTARLLGRLTLNPLSHIDLIGTIVFPVLAALSGLPLIGWAKPVPVNPQNLQAPRRDFAIVAAAGPASNFLLATGGIVLLMFLVGDEVTGAWHLAFLRYFVQMNALLGVFNLLPVPPLDGGNILAGLVSERSAQLLDRIRPYGIIILYALILSGVLATIVTSVMRVLVRIVP
jgi:Zn-dependent protease